MKKILSAMIVALVAVSACAAERSVSVKGAINEIKVSDGVDVRYIPGSGPARVSIAGPEKNIGNVEVSIKGGVLHIFGKNNPGNDGHRKFLKHSDSKYLEDVKITLYAPAVGVFSAESGAELETSSAIDIAGKVASMKASSGGEIDIKGLTCGTLKCSSSSDADIAIKSLKAKTASFTATSGADIDVEGLTADVVDAKTASGGDISLDGVAYKANLNASSGSEIDIRKLRSPSVSVDKSSAGTIRKH